MKLKHKLALEWVKESEKVPEPRDRRYAAWLAGFEKAREMAAAIAEKEKGVISGAVAGRIHAEILCVGEEEAK